MQDLADEDEEAQGTEQDLDRPPGLSQAAGQEGDANCRHTQNHSVRSGGLAP